MIIWSKLAIWMIYDMQHIHLADCISFRCYSKQWSEINKDCLDSNGWAGRIWPTIGKISLCMHHPIPHSAECIQGIILSEIATACRMTLWVGLQALVRLTSSGLRSQDLWTTTPGPPPWVILLYKNKDCFLAFQNFTSKPKSGIQRAYSPVQACENDNHHAIQWEVDSSLPIGFFALNVL